ncbi:condensation domain-containing protein [Streptomyces sp. NBC_00250]|uniref:condensation domain-containing protein n=1 Tax=Streptomyces sp. NBC_00250 TaxID=2903641 RepID=UPI002E2DF05F|nr:condensation domain-containing protein [Streptomyces sp. NBC_00250]
MNDTLDRTGEHQVLVTSARDGQAPLTWAQRLQWDDTEWLKPHDHYYNQYRVLAVPEGCGPPELLECLRVVMSRHESLRTRFPLDADGTPRQRLSAADELAVPVYRAVDPDRDPAAAVSELAARLRGRSFDLTHELPLRCAVLEHDGRPRHLVLVVSHVAIDHTGLGLLTDELESLLSGRTTPAELQPVGRRPFEQAAEEAGAVSRRRSAAALDYWAEILRAAPATTFDPPGGAPPPLDDPLRFGQVSMSSPALTRACRTVADRLGVSGTTVVMAALNAVLGGLTGRERVPLKLIASNRGPAELRTTVGITIASCVTLVPTGGRSFAEIVRDTGHAALRAYRKVPCDTVLLSALRAEVAAERGVPRIDLACGFNDLRAARPPSGDPADGGAHAGPAAPTRFTWDGNRPRQEVTLWYWVNEVDGVDVHHALVDLWYLPAERTEELLRNVERIVVEAAGESTPG